MRYEKGFTGCPSDLDPTLTALKTRFAIKTKIEKLSSGHLDVCKNYNIEDFFHMSKIIPKPEKKNLHRPLVIYLCRFFLNYNPLFKEICVGKSNHVSIKEQDLAQKRRVKEMDPITLSSHTCCSLSEIQFGFFSTRSKQGKSADFFVIVPKYYLLMYLVRAITYRNSNFVFCFAHTKKNPQKGLRDHP